MYLTRVERPSLLGHEYGPALDLLLEWIRDGKRPEPGLLVK
jgi:hypothetical protein